MDFGTVGQRRRRLEGVYRVKGEVLKPLVASPDASYGFGLMKERTEDYGSTNSSATYFIGSQTEESSFALAQPRNKERKNTASSSNMIIDEDILTEREVHRNSPSIIEKSTSLEKLPLQQVYQKQDFSLSKCLHNIRTVEFQKNHVSRPKSLSKNFVRHQQYSEVMDSGSAAMITESDDISENYQSFLKSQNSLSKQHVCKGNWPASSSQARKFSDTASKSATSIHKQDTVYSSKRHRYQATRRPSYHFNVLNSSYRSLSSPSAEIVRNTGRKELPKRLKMTNQDKEIEQKSLSSLGKVSSLSTKETKSDEFGSSVILKIINEKSAKAKVPTTQVFSSTKQHGWKNGNFINLSPSTDPLFSQTGSLGVATSNKQRAIDTRRYSIKDILRARNLAKKTERLSLKSDKNSSNYDKKMSSDDTEMNYVLTSLDGMEVEPESPESFKPDRQMSPVSVLELQLKEDNSELSMNDYDVISENANETEDCQLVPDTGFSEEEFMDDDERDYTYLLDLLIISGIHGVNQERLYNAGWFLKYPLDDVAFEKMEKKYYNLVSWSKSERKLFFHRINSILGEILAPCMDLHPWVSSNRRLAPMWGSEGLVEKVWEMLIREHKKMSVGKAEEKVLDGIWLDVGNVVDEIGRVVERRLLEELVEEFVLEFV